MKKKLIPCLVIVFMATSLSAQKTIVIEDIRCYSFIGPVMLYLKSPEIYTSFVGRLNKAVKEKIKLQLNGSSVPIHLIQSVPTETKREKITDPDTNKLHLFIGIYEYAPSLYFANIPTVFSDSIAQTIKSVFQLTAILVKSNNEIVYDRTLHMLVSDGETQGMGIVSTNLPVTAKGFVELLGTGFNMLFDNENELAEAQVKAAPAFVEDNLLRPMLLDHTRIKVVSKKDMAAYNMQEKHEILRFGEAFYENIKLRGRDATKLSANLTSAINASQNSGNSDFLFLRQESRDVARNKNYLLQFLVQINPQAQQRMRMSTFTGFVKGPVNYLLNDMDTVAVFSATTKISEAGKTIFGNKVWNGYDSATSVLLGNKPVEIPLIYDYKVTGKVGTHNFSINCIGNNTVKEIWLDKKLIGIAQGKFMPERFVIFDASLSTELLNQLMIIGFARFFE